MTSCEPIDRSREILFETALICGAGANAHSVVRELVDHALVSPERRSCIDGGTPWLLVVRCPGGRVLDVCVRQPDTPGQAQTWRRTRLEGFDRESWYTRLFPGAGQAALGEARDITIDAGVCDEFSRLHSCLGGGARPFLVGKQHHSGDQRVWIGWQLDREFHPSRAFASCGAERAWEKIAPVLQSLLGRPVPLRSHGWCLLAGIGVGQQTRIRLGTTHWSRIPESRAKTANLRQTVRLLGGDPCFAEAVYRLLLPNAGGTKTFVRPVGCAVELEVGPDGAIESDFFLRIPCRASTAKLPTRIGASPAAA